MRACQADSCRNYSDCDVYYSDDRDESLCAKHAWEAKDAIQIVPQHGGDNVNIPMEETS